MKRECPLPEASLVARRVLVLGFLACGACHGPLSVPMVERLPEALQRDVEDSWANMFSPPDRLERTLLLDVLVTFQLHEKGVDKLTLVSEKSVGQARVIMTVNFDRASPASDEFTITYLDEQGKERRREKYTSDEVKERLHFLFTQHYAEYDPSQTPATHPAETPDQRRDSQEQEARCRALAARMEEIVAATQPAEP